MQRMGLGDRSKGASDLLTKVRSVARRTYSAVRMMSCAVSINARYGLFFSVETKLGGVWLYCSEDDDPAEISDNESPTKVRTLEHTWNELIKSCIVFKRSLGSNLST